MNEETDTIRVYSSWRGRILAFTAPLILVTLGAAATAKSGVKPLSGALLVIGAVLGGIALLDYPLSATFDDQGVRRRMVLRSQLLRWSRVSALDRAPTSRRKRGVGPLSAIVGRRRYLLIDRGESTVEFELIRAILARSNGVALSASPPDAKAPPTWLYHRAGTRVQATPEGDAAQ